MTLDRVSAFGRVELLTRVATGDDNSNETLKNDIAAELLAASQNLSEEVHSVSVIELVGDAGENITCHYEILLNIQSEMSDDLETTLALSGMDYDNGLVRLQGEFISFVHLSFAIVILWKLKSSSLAV